MKKTLSILFVFIACSVQAQTWAEWTKQKKTQIKYLADQIGALQIYAEYLQKGYAIAKEGINTIQSIKKGDYSLHGDYFNSLKTVNPKIKTYWKVADIIALQVQIVQLYHKQKKLAIQGGQLTKDERDYCNNVFTKLLDGCTNIIDQLLLIEKDGSSEMKDDERIKRIDDLYADMKDKCVFAQHFSSETNEMQTQRTIEANDVKTSRALLIGQ